MLRIPLKSIPNQELSCKLEGVYFDFICKEVNGVMSITITRGNLVVVQNVRCAPFTPLIPYQYLEGITGNLCFVTPQGEYPYYTHFEQTHLLYYVTATELEQIRLTV